MARRRAAWATLAETAADVALVQEASRPDPGWGRSIGADLEPPWQTSLLGGVGPWRTAVMQLSDAVELRHRTTAPIAAAASADLVVSRAGSIAVADVLVDAQVIFTVASVYAAWEKVGGRGFADGSAHRILSDLTVLAMDSRVRLLVAGDWNLLYGYGEHGDPSWKARYDTVFARADTLGLRFVGPQSPHGRQADPWPAELPLDSRCVPTFHHARQTPATATRQLDFVFATTNLADRVHVQALNTPETWGPSDHCRIIIDIDT